MDKQTQIAQLQSSIAKLDQSIQETERLQPKQIEAARHLENQPLEKFIALLKQHGIDAVVDVRLRNEGRYYKFASGKHIKALVESHGIAYVHELRFAPTAEMIRRYRKDGDWPAYEQAYYGLMIARNILAVWQEVAGQFSRPCLLCAEKSPVEYHRRLLAECFARNSGSFVK
jgi:uncharacterized protein (DUF488 family)